MRTLPILPTAKSIYRIAHNNAGAALKLAGPWLLILGAILLVLNVLGIPLGYTLEGQTPKFTLQGFLAMILFGVFYAYGFAATAVSWHRFQLNGEAPKGFAVLNYDKRSMSYLLAFIGLTLLLSLCAIPISITYAIVASQFDFPKMVAEQGASFFVFSIISYAILAVVGAYFMRALLRLVAIALGENQHTLSNVWAATSGYVLPIAAVSFLVEFPFTAVNWLISSQAVSATGVTAYVLTGLSYAVTLLGAFVGIVTLTKLYEFFILQKEI